MSYKVPVKDRQKFERIRAETLNKILLEGRGRQCSSLPKDECYAECEWIDGWIFGGKCKDRNVIKQYMNYLCSRDSTTRQDLIYLIDIIKPENFDEDYSEYDKDELCDVLYDNVDFYHNFLLSQQKPPWEQLGISRDEYIQSIALAKANFERGEDTKGIITSVSNFLQENKEGLWNITKIVFVATIIVLVIALPFFIIPTGNITTTQVTNYRPANFQIQEVPFDVRVTQRNLVSKPMETLFSRAGGLSTPTFSNKEFLVPLPEYKMEIVGEGTSYVNAKDIAEILKRGIEKSADVCKMRESVCLGNLGLARNEMPQIMTSSPKDMIEEAEGKIEKLLEKLKNTTDPNEIKIIEKGIISNKEDINKAIAVIRSGGHIDEIPKRTFFRYLYRSGYDIYDERVKVGNMRASQKEIKAAKTYGMSDAYLKGKFKNLTEGGVLSIKETTPNGETIYTVLDGHHRFAALLLVDPERSLLSEVIEAPPGKTAMDVINIANSTPGIFHYTLQDEYFDLGLPPILNFVVKDIPFVDVRMKYFLGYPSDDYRKEHSLQIQKDKWEWIQQNPVQFINMLRKSGTKDEDIQMMLNRQKPLEFATLEEYNLFKNDLRTLKELLEERGYQNVQFVQRGPSVVGYDPNPMVGNVTIPDKIFDSSSPTQITVDSDNIDENILRGPTADFARKWKDRLGRNVVFVPVPYDVDFAPRIWDNAIIM